MKKVSMTKIFQYEAGLTLSLAKQTTDNILENKIVVIEMTNLEDAKNLAKKVTDLGAVCSIVEDIVL